MGRLSDIKTALNVSNETMEESNRSGVQRSVYEASTQPVERSKNLGGESVTPQVAQSGTPVDSVLGAYTRITGSYCNLQESMIAENIQVIRAGLPDDIRMVSLDSVMFAAEHFAEVTAGLILNHDNCRTVFTEFILSEIDLLSKDEAERVKIHKELGDMSGFSATRQIELGVTRYSADVELEIMRVVNEGFDKISDTALSAAVDGALGTMTEDDRNDVGAILSNPIPLLIALNNNSSFAEMITILSASLKEKYLS